MIKRITFPLNLALIFVFIVLTKTSFAQNTKSPVENVTKETREKVVEIRNEYPEFKLGKNAQKCIEDKIIDPECDPLINDEVRVYRKKQQVAAKKQQVAAKEQQVAAEKQQVKIASEAADNIVITIALIQLAMYVDFDKMPSAEANQMEKILTFEITSLEVKNIFTEFLSRKKKNDVFTWEKDEKRLMKLAENHLDRSIFLQKELSHEKLSKTIAEMIQSAQFGYKQTYGALLNKMR